MRIWLIAAGVAVGIVFGFTAAWIAYNTTNQP